MFNETHNTMTSVNTTNNITSLTIYGLVKSNNYSFALKGIDYLGQLWNNSQLVYLIFDGKKMCLDLQKGMLHQFSSVMKHLEYINIACMICCI